MYSYGSLHMAKQKQGDKLEPTYSSSEYTGCSSEDLPKEMDDREGWRERVRDIRADGTTRWWDVCVCVCVWMSDFFLCYHCSHQVQN